MNRKLKRNNKHKCIVNLDQYNALLLNKNHFLNKLNGGVYRWQFNGQVQHVCRLIMTSVHIK